MSYFGFVEVEVRLMREGFGPEGKDTGEIARRVVQISEADATAYGHVAGKSLTDEREAEVSASIQKAVKEVLDEDSMGELLRRWRDATSNLDADKMRAALEAIERA